MSTEFEEMAKVLEGTGDYRILRRLQRRDRFAELEPNDTHIGVVLDVETTGLDTSVDELKARGYRWNNGSDGRPKSWYRDLEEEGTEDEIEFLRTYIYRRDVDIKVQLIDALSRFSIRD
jgi:hypothetical protein